MRILHMIPDIGISNGIMSVILNYAKAMPEDIKFDVIYFAEKEKTRQKDIEALGGRVFKVDKPSPRDLLGGKMKTFFNEHKGEWQAVHIHCPHFAVFIAPFAKRAGIKKIAVHCHSSVYSLKGSQRRNRILSLYAKYFVKTKFACSRVAGDFWYGGKNFTVLNNGINCRKFAFDEKVRAEVRQELGIESSFAVAHIGRTDVPQKNHQFIFNTFAEVKKKKDNAVLILIGAEKTEELAKAAASLGIENSIYYLGIRNDINRLLCAADVFLFPSTREGLPVSVVEAQAAGVPVLMSDSVTDEVCITELVLTKPLSDSYESWADALLGIKEHNRVQMCNQVIASGWDIYDCGRQLAEYYKN